MSQNNDIEKKLYQELAKIQELKDKVDELELRIDELSEKVERIELSGFQEQITAINSKFKNLESMNLVTCRFVAYREVDNLYMSLDHWTAAALGTNDNLYQQVHEYLVRSLARVQQKIMQSETPLTLANEYREECQKYFHQKGLSHAFREE